MPVAPLAHGVDYGQEAAAAADPAKAVLDQIDAPTLSRQQVTGYR